MAEQATPVYVVSALQSAIDDQVLEVNSVRYVSLNIVYESAEAVLDNHCSTHKHI